MVKYIRCLYYKHKAVLSVSNNLKCSYDDFKKLGCKKKAFWGGKITVLKSKCRITVFVLQKQNSLKHQFQIR